MDNEERIMTALSAARSRPRLGFESLKLRHGVRTVRKFVPLRLSVIFELISKV